jgi:hypothetical protein
MGLKKKSKHYKINLKEIENVQCVAKQYTDVLKARRKF